jgi:hypothetical protein
MKKRHLFVINLVFIGLMVFSAAVVIQFMTGMRPLALVSQFRKDTTPVKVVTNNCSAKPPIAQLEQAKATGLQKLAVYQQACHSMATDTAMMFIGMPSSDATVASSAKQTADLLKEYKHYGIKPLVIAEPSDYTINENIDFGEFALGKFTPFLDHYFAELKAQGVDSSAMGIWNPFPEANLPYWKNNQPQYFAPAVNIYIATLHKYFPGVNTSIMLNSATYETTDFNWENGDYSSWLPYIKAINPGTINYVGMQGFPWASPKGGKGLIINAAEFLNPEILSEAATYLKVKNVWYNTGTFSEKYSLDPERRVTIAPEQRKAILATVVEQVGVLKDEGYNVSVNIFAQDKRKTQEETDWSYWQGNDPFSSPATPVITQFIQQLNDNGTPVWLFDK